MGWGRRVRVGEVFSVFWGLCINIVRGSFSVFLYVVRLGVVFCKVFREI